MMELHTLIYLHLMKIYMKVGIITNGINKLIIQNIDIIDSQALTREHA